MNFKIIYVFTVLSLLGGINVFAQNSSSSDEKLMTEFVKLKNVPDCEKDKSRCFGMKVSFKRFIDTAKIYFTRRGSIEIDRRSKTIIITDVFSNIEFMKMIILAYDNSEMFLIDEDEIDDIEKSECEGYAGGNEN